MFRCSHCGAFNRVPANRPAGEAICGKCKRALDTSGAPQDVTGEQLMRSVASAPIPVLLDLWAPWCGPCKVAGPILEELGRKHAGSLLVLKVNTDDHPDVGASFEVRGIPTFIAFKAGREFARQPGLLPKAHFESWVGSIVA